MGGTSAQGEPVKKNGGAGKDKGKDKGKGKATPWDFMTELRKYEVGFGQEGKHRFEVSSCVPGIETLQLICTQTELAPANDRQERYDLYLRYQVAVHKDPPGRVSKRGFEGFLVDSPLSVSDFQTQSAGY
jgi:arginine-tRNA-protein transferase